MAALVWDKTGERRIETGVDHCALYVYDPAQKTYGKGVGFGNGITAISEKPEAPRLLTSYAEQHSGTSRCSRLRAEGHHRGLHLPRRVRAV